MSKSKDEADKDLVSDFRDRDSEASEEYKKFLKEAKLDYGFYGGHQWNEEDSRLMDLERRPYVTFNQTRPVVDVVVGSEITNRFDIKYLARSPGDESRETAGRLMTETVRYIRDRCRAPQYESKAFWDMVVCGLGCIEVYEDYERDPDGETVIKRVSPFYMRPDPFARECNLRDKKYVIRRAWISKKDLKFMWPDSYEKVFDNVGTVDSIGTPGAMGIQRIAGYSAKDAGFFDSKSKEFLVNDYQYYERKKWWRIQNPISSDIQEIYDIQKKRDAVVSIVRQAEAESFPLTDQWQDEFINELPRREYWRAYVCGDVVLSKTKIKTNNFTYFFLTGFEDHDEKITKWFGLMRPMRDPQRWANKFFSQMIYIVSTNPKGGLYYEDGAFEDEQAARRDGAAPNAWLKLLPGGFDKLHEREALSLPSGLDTLMEQAINAIPNVTGVNYFMQGLQQGDHPGVVVQKYQEQGMVILATLFDSLNQYRQDMGETLLSYIREYMPDGMIIRINDEQGGDQVIEYSKDLETHKFDVVVTQSPTSPNQQKEFWDMITQTNLLGQLMQMGFPVPPSIFNYMPLPDQFRKDWVQAVQQSQQQQAEQAQQQQRVQQAQEQQNQQNETTKLDTEKAQKVAEAANAVSKLRDGLPPETASAGHEYPAHVRKSQV